MKDLPAKDAPGKDAPRKDALVPFVFEHLSVRGAIVQLSNQWRQLLSTQNYTPNVLEVLGHAAAATPLIAQSMKAGSSVTLQLTGSGPMSVLVMQCTSELNFRGLATTTDKANGLSYAELVAESRCAITVDNVKTERPYQGIIQTSGESLAASLENYYLRSAQTPSHLCLVANEEVCGGILLQQIAGGEEPLGDDWDRLGYLSKTLRLQDVIAGAGPDLIGKLFAEDDVRVFPAMPAQFKCRCSRQRAADVLKLLGKEECRLLDGDDEQIVVTCEYCGSRERFDPVDIASLFANVDDMAPPTLH